VPFPVDGECRIDHSVESGINEVTNCERSVRHMSAGLRQCSASTPRAAKSGSAIPNAMKFLPFRFACIRIGIAARTTGTVALLALVRHAKAAWRTGSVMSMLANLVIEASRFEAIARPLDASTVADPRRSDDALWIRFGLAAGCPPDRARRLCRSMRVGCDFNQRATLRARRECAQASGTGSR
jgi:hypothetical protein